MITAITVLVANIVIELGSLADNIQIKLTLGGAIQCVH